MKAPTLPEILQSPTAAYDEGLRFFRGEGLVNETLKRLAEDLEQAGIAYCVIGAVALNQHGYRRFTADIDLLMTPAGLAEFRQRFIGRGYRPAWEGAARTFRALPENVPIEIITAGEYPGDGKPKPVQFPDPAAHFEVMDGVRVVSLPTLIELKLASGLSAPGRLKDLADVQELIRFKKLDEDFAAQLSPYVRDKFLELWRDLNGK